jgi:hypothetical protein
LGTNLEKTKSSLKNKSSEITLNDFSFSSDIASAIKGDIEGSIRRDIITKLWTSINTNDNTIMSIMDEIGKDKLNDNQLNHKHSRSVTKCKHYNKKHYAKGMCYNCYHRQGRHKKAWECKHKDKPHYAKGLCNNCYQVLFI